MRSQVLLRYRLGLLPAILVALLILQAWHVWGENIDDDVILLDVNAALEEGDYERAFLLFEQLAQEGHAHAQYRTGVMFAIGQGVAPDTVQAVRWYLRAAEQEHQGAQYHLALHYQRGEGIAQNFLEAARWYRKAAEQGDALAQNNLGLMYAHGQGVPENHAEAVRWYCQSALNIDPLSASKIDPPEQASGGRRWSLEKQTYPPLVHGPACLKHIGGAVYKGWISLAGPSGLWPGPSGWAVEGASPIRNGS